MSLDSDRRNSDPEIDAAFSGASVASPQEKLSDDPEIHAAFSAEPESRTKEGDIYDPEGEAARALSIGSQSLVAPIANIPYAALHGAQDVLRRSTHSDVNAPDSSVLNALHFPLSEDAKSFSTAIGSTLKPVTEAAKRELSGNLSNEEKARLKTVAPIATDVAAMYPAASIGYGLMSGLGRSSKLPKLTASGAPEAQEAMNAAASGKSIGAASTAADISAASPELQKAIIETTRKTGGAVNPEVLNRRLEADSLPVKMSLTEGQATQDPSTISNEMNMRGKHKELADAYNQQNGQLVDNLRAIRESAGPDVFSTNPVEHGDTIIQAYKDKAASADADISAKYNALRDAAGGKFPVDAKKLLSNASQELHNNLLYDNAPKSVMSTLDKLAYGNNMTFENFESLRTNLARVQRTATDGNERAAAGIIRGEMEKLPLSDEVFDSNTLQRSPGAAKIKPLADAARSAAKNQFQALEADPAYKAAVNDEVTPDKFVSKFIVNGSRDNVAKMKANLSHDDRASQTMGVAALDHLRDQAKIDSMGNGNFASASFNKHLEAMRPKLQSIVPPEQANQLDTLGKVSRYTTAQPKGSFVNNSNTLVGALAGHGANVLEGVANVKAGGIPVGSMVRGAFGKRAEANAVKRALDPSSGLERLKEYQ